MNSNDEYFCTNCGANLSEQSGFNPDDGSWTCTKCRQLLYGNVYEGDKYPGVMWYCDGCGTLLNKQSGFSDIKGAWVCIECEYCNSIDESQIQKETFKEKLLKAKPMLKKVLKWTLIAAGAVAAAAVAIKVSKNGDTDEEYNEQGFLIGNTNDSGGTTLSSDEGKSIANPCANCGMSLTGGAYTAPWEEGNPDGYIKCPHCRYINFQWED